MVVVAVVTRFASEALLLSGQSRGFAVDRLGEGERLPAVPNLMLVVQNARLTGFRSTATSFTSGRS